MPKLKEAGFAPVLILVALALLGIVAIVANRSSIKDVKPALVGSPSATQSASPSPSLTSKATAKVATSSNAPSPSSSSSGSSSTPSSSSNNSSGSNSSSSNNQSNNSTSSTSNSSPSPSSASSPTPTPSPSPSSASSTSTFVRVIYPNGGETLHQGDNINVTWDTNIAFGTCFIQTVDANNSGISITGQFDTWAPNKSIAWTVNMGNTTLSSQQFKIYMLCHNANTGEYVKGYSDNYFTISK